ncbi:MAG: hypothetical protein GX288_10655 [Clostridiales bacterium]|nr:hypothetical protein [Clostridiales bacterium]
MNKRRWKAWGSIYPLIWTLILLASGFILIKFAILSGSGKVGQAKESLGSNLISNVCIKLIETSSSYISYSMVEEPEDFSFPIIKIMDGLSLHAYNKHTYSKAAVNYSFDTATYKNIENKGYNKGLIFRDLTEGHLEKEYVLSNGAVFAKINGNDSIRDNIYHSQLNILVEKGNVFLKETDEKSSEFNQSMETMKTNKGVEFTLDQLKDVNFLIRNFYIVDADASINQSLFDSEKLLQKDMTIKQSSDKPQILIYHTHSQEAYIDSREGVVEDTVVGIGSLLKEVLEKKYGYNVIHDKSVYDMVDGKLDRSYAYNLAKKGIDKILEKYPSIEVVIDLHRDGAAERAIMLDGKETAQVMLLNGLSRDTYGPITRLDNPNLEDNLAFSLKLQLKSLELYPGFFFKNYLHCYRYNLHVREKSMLVEWGTHMNTLQSAKNAVEPFAKVLDAVLQGR